MKKWTVVWLILTIFCVPMTQTRAQDEAPAIPAPATVQEKMPSGAISLRWQKMPVSQTAAVWVHLYCKPTGRSDEAAKLGGFDAKTSGPITRDEISAVPGIKWSPFWLDVWKDTGAQNWQRLSSAPFMKDGDVNRIVLRWLDPKLKTGPILLLDFGLYSLARLGRFHLCQRLAASSDLSNVRLGRRRRQRCFSALRSNARRANRDRRNRIRDERRWHQTKR